MMNKKILHATALAILTAGLLACSSPEEKAADYIKNATELFNDGEFKKAEIEYKNALQINQNLPDAWYGLAKLHERRQQWPKAYTVLNKIRELAPEHLDGRIMLAQMLLASNQIDQALNDATDVLQIAPGDARAHSLMAAVQFRLGNFDIAQEEVDKALAIDSASTEAILVRGRIFIAEQKYDEAIALLDAAIAKNPEDISMYLMKLQAYQETRNKQAMEAVYRDLIKQFPENTGFKNALAGEYIKDKNIDGAERLLEEVIQADPEEVEQKLRFVEFKNQYRSQDDAIALLKSYMDSSEEELRYHFLLGEIYERNNQAEEAVNVYQGVVDQDGLKANGLEARNRIALIDLRAGNREKAEKLVKEVLGHDKNNENALLLQTGFHIADEQFDDAIVSARTVLRDNPDSIKALGLLGQAYDASGSRELANESYTKAFQISPGTPVIANQLTKNHIRQRNYTQANEILERSIASGNRSIDALKLLTQIKLSLGEWDKAELLAKQLKSIEGQEVLSEQVLGAVYMGKQDQEAGVNAFKRAYELAPTSVQPMVSLVRVYVRSGKTEEARRFLDSVLATNSDNLTANLLLAQLNLYENKMPEAIRYFNKVIEIDPRAESSYRNLAVIYQRQNDFEKAEMVTKQGLSAMPEQPILEANLASIYERQGNYDKAIDLYESMLEKKPDLIVAKNNLASLLSDHRDDQASFDRARRISNDLKSSEIPQFRDTYAWASVKAGTGLEEAVLILEGVVKDNEQVGVYNYHLGEAYRKKGDAKNAKAYLNKAVELAGPDSVIGKKAKDSLGQLSK